uniref:Uncharacterized protein n=1 Tax=Anguilla anguilla TaxID=7936 RepID=A0A0E9XJN8_ANGAN
MPITLKTNGNVNVQSEHKCYCTQWNFIQQQREDSFKSIQFLLQFCWVASRELINLFSIFVEVECWHALYITEGGNILSVIHIHLQKHNILVLWIL